jgi:hypothetical protein
MAVLTMSFVDQVFDKKSAEVGYLAKALMIAAQQLQASGGASSVSTNIIGNNAAGTANSTLGSYTYTASATNP